MAERHHPLSLTLVSPEDQAPTPPPTPEGVWLRLEQAPLPQKAAGDFQAWFQEQYGGDWSKYNPAEVMQFWEEFKSLCNEEGEFTAEIWVHKSADDLPYRLDATRGRWLYDEPQGADDQKTQQLAIRQESSTTIDGENVQRIICAQWEGNVYDELGAKIIPRPRIQVDTETHVLSWGRPVTGTLRVVYLVEYDVWYLVISPRTTTGDSVGTYAGEGGEGSGGSSDDGSGYGVAVCTEAYDEDQPGGVYAATVYGVYAGGIEELEVETPDLTGNCRGGGGGGDDDPEEELECYKLRIKYHKCTGELISKEVIRVPCPPRLGGEEDV